jgi:hypothetical protein
VTLRYLPFENFTDQKLTNDLCLSVRYIFFKDRIDKKENKLNHKWVEGKGLEKNGRTGSSRSGTGGGGGVEK